MEVIKIQCSNKKNSSELVMFIYLESLLDMYRLYVFAIDRITLKLNTSVVLYKSFKYSVLTKQ